jgi:folate-binding protein YgfZ
MPGTRLFHRAVLRLSAQGGDEDVVGFLQGLLTNDVTGQLPAYAALLSAQGKTLFDAIIWPAGPGELLVECEAAWADDFAKRLRLYRLRRAIEIERDDTVSVHWQKQLGDGGAPDPRLPELGQRWLAPVSPEDQPADDEWLAHRLSLGVPEGAELADILWLETNAVELNGVSFDKGCFIGQENTARMNWRQKVNRRLVVVPLDRSDEKRRKAAHPDLGLAVDHRRVTELDGLALPDWQREAISSES